MSITHFRMIEVHIGELFTTLKQVPADTTTITTEQGALLSLTVWCEGKARANKTQ